MIEAAKKNITLFDLMNEKASEIVPGSSGLLVLDWWNGNRSILGDTDLSGMIVGLDLQTRPEEIYRAIIEATAFGTRMIVEHFIRNGICVNNIVACGGLSKQSDIVMQIFADVLGKRIKVSSSSQTSALGAAMYGAVAARGIDGGYDGIYSAINHMSCSCDKKSF